jgi:hypothetical protein
MSIFGPKQPNEKEIAISYAEKIKDGILHSKYDIYADYDGAWHQNLTLPRNGEHINKHFTILHKATLNTTVKKIHTNLEQDLTLTKQKNTAVFLWNGYRWVLITHG